MVFGCHFDVELAQFLSRNSELVFWVPKCINECISDTIHLSNTLSIEHEAAKLLLSDGRQGRGKVM